MNNIITQPGFYRQRNGCKAEVFAERDGWWYGRIREAQCEYESWSEMSWTASGLELGNPPMESDHDITGPWIDEPDPGAGWRFLEPHEVVLESDEHSDTLYPPIKWHENPYHGWIGRTAKDLESRFANNGLRFRRRTEEWKPTCEFAQKWVCGDKSEWRAIEVKQ